MKIRCVTTFLGLLFAVIIGFSHLSFAENRVSKDKEPEQDENMPLADTEVLDLKTAQEISLRNNPSLAAALARVRQARARIEQAQSAYWPLVDASVSGSRIKLSENEEERSFFTGAFPGFSGDAFSTESPQDYYSTSLTASWVVFDGFERKFATAAAKYGYKESRAARQDARRLLLAAVANAYYNALLARENIRIAEADENFNLKQLKDAQARRRVGTGTLSDVLNFQVQINAARSNKIAFQRSYHVALYGLAALMGIPDSTLPGDWKLTTLESEAPEEFGQPSPEQLIDYAEANRPDVLQTVFATKRAEKAVGVERAPYYPEIRLIASLDGERVNSARFSEDDFGNTITLNLTYNLFAGGFYRASLAEAKYRQTEAEKVLEDTLIFAREEVHEAFTRLASAQEQLLLQRNNAKLVRRNRELVEKEYSAGETSLVRLNEAQRDLIQAESRLVLALASLRQARQELLAATGQILIPFEKTPMTDDPDA